MSNPGDLDLTFGTNGLVITDISGNSNDYGLSLVLQSDGKLILGGYSIINSIYYFTLVRYNANGQIDTTYGNQGKVLSNFGNGLQILNKITIQTDNKVITVGYINQSNNYNFIVARYNTNGTLDTSFGGGTGYVITDVGQTAGIYNGDLDQANDVIVNSNGKILVGGISLNRFALVQYNSDGTLDTTFNSTGIVFTTISYVTAVSSITLQSDGKVLLAGTFNTNTSTSTNNFGLIRYNSNGSLDTTFNNTGIVSTDFNNFANTGTSVIVQPNGKIIFGGSTFDNITYSPTLCRYNKNGTLDQYFGSGGKVITNLGSYYYLTSISLQTDGKILAALKANNTFSVIRYNDNGTIDTSFGTNGIVNTNFLTGSGVEGSGANSLVIQSDNKIIVGGTVNDSFNSTGNFGLARYISGFVLPSPICFPKGTPVLTDQGNVEINKLNPTYHTIRGNKIVAITQTITTEKHIVCIERNSLGTNVPSQKTYISRQHKILYNKEMVEARNLVGKVNGIYNKKYNGEILYNVLLETYNKMLVNNLIVETLDPENAIARFYTSKYINDEDKKYISFESMKKAKELNKIK